MFYGFDDEKFRYIGRWGKESETAQGISASACGSRIEFAFKGRELVIFFDISNNVHPHPHIYISIDGGARIESTVQKFIRVDALTDGEHKAEIIYKSAMEIQNRWFRSLNGKITFAGVRVRELLKLEVPKKKTIEFVGDSITEGVLIDVDLTPGDMGQEQRPFHDDVTATYAYLTAEALGLEPYIMGYGAVGVTRGGCGNVPECPAAYPYCFDGVEKSYAPCDYILINHGANDRYMDVSLYLKKYGELLDVVISLNPSSKIISLSAFCGAHHNELGEFIKEYNIKNNTDILFIDSCGWVPAEPLHPLRDGHKIIAENLVSILENVIK